MRKDEEGRKLMRVNRFGKAQINRWAWLLDNPPYETRIYFVNYTK